MMEYFNSKIAKKHQDHAEKSEAPVLTDEDEAFLQRIATEGTPPPLPERPQDFAVAGETKGNDAQIALMSGAQNVPLPDVPDTPDGVMPAIEGEHGDKEKGKAKEAKRPFSWSFLRRDSRDGRRKVTATDLHNIAEGLKAPDAKPNEDNVVTPHEASKEEEEMTVVLEQLNLAAVNNRVFSISKESQDLLKKYLPNLAFPLCLQAHLTTILPKIYPCSQRSRKRRPNCLRRPRIPPHKFRAPTSKILRPPSLFPPKTHRTAPLQIHRLPRSRNPRRCSRKTRSQICLHDASRGSGLSNGHEDQSAQLERPGYETRRSGRNVTRDHEFP